VIALVATVAGILMVGGGIYGVVNDVSGDDDDDTPVTVTTTTFPGIPTTPTTSSTPGFDPCREAAARDLRLNLIDALDLQPVGKETGTAEVTATCAGETVSLSIRLSGMTTGNESNSYLVWLYKSRRKAKQVGSLIGPEDSAFGSATITVDTSPYDEIVITRVPFGKGERRPRKIVFRGSL
jgi:hypothetical protein